MNYPEPWAGAAVSCMFMNRIPRKAVANRLNITAAYLSMILNGKCNPENARTMIFSAINELIEERDDHASS